MQDSGNGQGAPAGRVWVYNGDIWYSPNSVWFTPPPPHDHKPPRFTPGQSTAVDSQLPQWWDIETEWIGFVPTQPVLYEGAWFGPLNSLPDMVHALPTGRYQLNKARISVWTRIEETLTVVVRTLKKKNAFRCLMPFAPKEWKYDAVHHTEEAALMHIKNGRDWFAMWIGLLYWMTRKSINPASFVEGISAPTWFIQLVQELPLQQAIWDLVRTAPLLQRSMRWNWVGVWLHHPANVNGQPSAQWFVDQRIPVWYRWEHREDQSNQNPFFALISPSAEERQSATTLIFSAPSMYLPVDVVPLNMPHGESAASFLDYNHFHESFPTRMPDYHHFGKTSESAIQDLPGKENDLRVEENCLRNSCTSEIQTPPDTSHLDPNSKDVDVRKTATAAAKKIWDTFWEKRKATHERMLKEETPMKREVRQNRERNKPRKSAKVYEWGWNTETPPKFVKELVRIADREETLAEHEDLIERRDSLPKVLNDVANPDIVPMRTSGHVFGKEDYDFYRRQCEYLLNLPRGRAALLRGGFVRRIALEHVGAWEARCGPCGVHQNIEHMFIAKDSNDVEYVDDNLTNDEFDALCGLYVTFTGSGEQKAMLSWYPRVSVFEGQGLDMGWWTDRVELLWETTTKGIVSSEFVLPLNYMKWRDKVQGHGDARRALSKLEAFARIIPASIFLHSGFLIADHILFQYNDLLFGILSVVHLEGTTCKSAIRAQGSPSFLTSFQGNKLASGILFAILLNFKHVYMSLALACSIYLLCSFCMTPAGRPEIKYFVPLANAVIGGMAHLS
ncbi:Dolichyl pyrophosphate Glc1Man9GlcNAc2 alpha-1,3-glucosyltransferase [Leucoagaricus sp. SymC.cos]|nr:Dolichyl pyrophosphate Glc1Man9GlcNAc2 alpha-1,3-glucosyltransferase [Leucoagaricus sp. SymC.cos]